MSRTVSLPDVEGDAPMPRRVTGRVDHGDAGRYLTVFLASVEHAELVDAAECVAAV